MLFSAKEIEENDQKILRKPKTSAKNDFPTQKTNRENKSKIKTDCFKAVLRALLCSTSIPSDFDKSSKLGKKTSQ
ncbi:hypothetical protein DW940_17255 [Bacteroides uniformis]|nr:hypothetical protein DW940_17255 [Bacteroides uniformis]